MCKKPFCDFFCFSVLWHIKYTTIRKAGKKICKKNCKKIFALKKFRHIKAIQKQVNASEREKEGDAE